MDLAYEEVVVQGELGGQDKADTGSRDADEGKTAPAVSLGNRDVLLHRS